MGNTIEDSGGGFYEVSNDRVISKNGVPFAQTDGKGNIQTFDGQRYTYSDGQIINEGNHRVEGNYNGDNMFIPSNTYGGSYTSGHASSGSGKPLSLGAVIVLTVIGILIVFSTVIMSVVSVFIDSVKENGSVRGAAAALFKVPDGASSVIPGINNDGLIIIIGALLYVFLSFCLYKIFKKCRKPLKHAFVPLLRLYDLYDIGCGKGYLAFVACIPGLIFIMHIYLSYKLTMSFGKTKMFFILYCFIPPLGLLNLSCGKAQLNNTSDAGGKRSYKK